MNNPQRRDFLRKSLGSIGAASALTVLPPSIRKALAVDAAVDTGTIKDVKHIVILMLENRGFDHYFGALKGVRGYGDRFPIPLETGKDVWYQVDGTGKEIPPYHFDPTKTKALQAPGTPHSFSDMQAAWNQGKSGHWPTYKTQYTMGYFRRQDIPFQYALAEAFTICDGYHCSTTSGTDPNRVVFFSGSGFDPALAKQGINSNDRTSEPNNNRCWITGTMPTPGYTYPDNALTWLSLPEVLENAGVSWKIYQNTNDNWTGAMHGGLAFKGFRTAAPGSPLYVKGLTDYSIADLKNDVLNDTLPEVSWILCTAANSEHPGNSDPMIGSNYTAQVLDAVTANPDVWSKTVFFLTYDENDGLFDHLAPPAPPSYNNDGSLAGKATLPLDGEYFSDPALTYTVAADNISPRGLRPWGLSARVPMYVVSPWSKGGWVNSQVFDHTSMGMFLEKRFDVTVDAISPWHRAVCGDLTSCFDFVSPNDPVFPTLPDTSNWSAVLAAQHSLPAATAPATAQPLYQETGTRFSRALPYELHTSARVETGGLVHLLFSNTGKQGAVFHVYDRNHLDRIPRRFTVEAGKTLEDFWEAGKDDAGKYNLWVYGSNGFVRTFQGDTTAQLAATFKPEVQVCYDPDAGQVYAKVHNPGSTAGSVTITPNAYRNDGPWTVNVATGAVGLQHWNLDDSGHWYDFTVTADNFERRFSGRVETGKPAVSDPAMALHLTA